MIILNLGGGGVKQRKISIEIIRILAIFMIVLGHTFTHGHASENIQNGFSGYLAVAVETFAVPGTDIFVLISGYFLSKAKTSIKRIILMWTQILFYSLSIFLLLTVFGLHGFSVVGLIKAVLPISFNQYWFMRVYFYLLLCAPFLNVLLNCLNKKSHQVMLALGIVLMVIPASIPGIAQFNGDAGNGILWFFMLYSTGAYFSKYPPKWKTKQYTITAFMMFFLAFLSRICISYVSARMGFHGMGESRLSTFDALPIYIEACCILCIGINLCNSDKINNNNLIGKIILFISSSTAGIYMIHEHPYVRDILWSKLNLESHTILYSVFIAVIILIVCSLVDYLTWKKVAKCLGKINTKKWREWLRIFCKVQIKG